MTLTDNTPLRRYACTQSQDYVVDGSLLSHQFDDYGNHRLYDPEALEHSPWTPYPFPAVLGDYRATTEYWSGTFPRVFKIVEASDA